MAADLFNIVSPVAKATAAAPAYTEGQPSGLSLDLLGNLRVTSSGGGGGAVTIANGADVALGSTTDAPATTPTTVAPATAIALLKALSNGVTVTGPTPDGTAASTNPVLISGTTDGTATGLIAVPKVTAGGVLSVDGSASTQPISAASLPLPTGAATSAAQTTMATNQTGGGQKTQIVDGSGNVISATANALDINIKSGSVSGLTQGPVAPGTATATKADVVGAQYNATMPTFTDGQQGSMQVGTRGELLIRLMNSNAGGTATFGNTNVDGVTSQASSSTLQTENFNFLYNGSTWDRLRGDVTGLWVGNEARTTNKTAATNGATVRPIATSIGAAVNKPFQVPELDWSYPAAAGGISNTTTAVTMVGAAGAGIRNYMTAIQLSAPTLGAATELAVRDGAGGTVIWRGYMSTAGGNQSVNLSSPVKSTANTLLEVVTLTATVTGAIYVNAQGYQAP